LRNASAGVNPAIEPSGRLAVRYQRAPFDSAAEKRHGARRQRLVLVDRLTKIFTRLFDRVAGVLRSVFDLISVGLLDGLVYPPWWLVGNAVTDYVAALTDTCFVHAAGAFPRR
jgi:hypothetical protein